MSTNRIRKIPKVGEQQIIPRLATGILLTDGGAPWTFGAAQTMIPAAGVGNVFRLTGFHVEAFSNSVEHYLLQFRELSTAVILCEEKFSASFAITVVNFGSVTRDLAQLEGVDARVATAGGANDTIRIALRFVEL